MIIQSLEMTHFRQYYGTQKIEFAHSDEGQIVTVILGDNGRGKTSLYRAIMFALFGDVKLAQDSEEAELILTNLKALKEQPSGVESIVTVNFVHDGQPFTMTRSFFAGKTDNKIKEQPKDQKLINKKSGEEWIKQQDIVFQLQRIVDERVKHYFFFDGERIERLTRVARQQKEEISTGIKNLLKIDEVLKSRDVLKHIMAKSKKELAQYSKGEYKKTLLEYGKKEIELEMIEQNEEKSNHLVLEMENRLSEIDRQLNEYESMKTLFQERDLLEENLKKRQSKIKEKIEQTKLFNEYLPLLMGEDTYHLVVAKLKSELDSEDLSGISSELINKLLEDMRCICGSSLNEKSSQYQELKILANSVEKYESTRSSHGLLSGISSLISFLSGRTEAINYAVAEIKELQYEQNQSQIRLEELNKHLSSSKEGHLNSLNNERMKLIKEIANIEIDAKNFQSQKGELESNLKVMKHRLKELQRQSGIREQLLKKNEILERSILSVSNLIGLFEIEMIEELERTTQQNLQYLLDSSGQSMIKNVKIHKDYSIEVYNAYDQPFLANISQGQRQVLSLSFITALAQVSGGDSVLEMPLLMDTPFGRLSEIHQRKLIEYLPNICSQWILLVTDREFGSNEKALFDESDAIGKYYQLDNLEAGVTTINEVNMSRMEAR
ncbi:AAA family ATPase [Anaerobacillus sp. 1_MG-2023]|uniref:AAA family ATPase n=1 Tax=Anaerobacillus sp. 1_MG-2023 TaxID=3062655 RepID=UPI0026E3F1C6|nr:AAA family ATPase [Anaerobacillus sp. 1_MG-2023]MDO6654515.1 AAA family ATPase [Anaerobacillus sp. 1_MG-2023]